MTTESRDQIIERLIRKEWPKLKRFFRSKVPDADVLDLVNATILAFVEGHARVTGSERGYLWGIARLQVLKHYERQRSSTPFDSTVHTAMDLGPSISSRLDRRTRLLQALHTLPVDQQIAVELRYGEGLSLDEVAESLGASLATAKRCLAAAIDSLRGQLGSEAEDVKDAWSRL